MASFLRPRRGKKATATSTLTGTAALKRGEVFFEVPTGGVGTGKGAIKMGDGSTAYASLPYFLSMDDSPVAFTDSLAPTSAPTNNGTLLTAIAPSASLATVLTNVKKLLHNYNYQITQLNNDLGILKLGDHSKIQFCINETGKNIVETWTLAKDCYFVSYVRTQSVAGTPFIRIQFIDSENINRLIFEGYGNNLARYNYLWSPPLFFKAGTKISLQCTCKIDGAETAASDCIIQAFYIY